MTIVYTSKTGFTREYAQMLGRAAGLPVCALDEATGKVGPGSDILYLGWLMAGHISGIDHAVKRFHVRAACGVGMTPPGDKVLTWPGPTMCQTPPSSTFRAAGHRKRWGGSSAGW